MVRYLFSALLLIHGLIHGIGFFNQQRLATIPTLSGTWLGKGSESVATTMGTCWLLVGLGFLITLAGYILQRNWWLRLALLCAVFSQVLIIIYWPDAQAGTLANLIILIEVGLSYAQLRFDKQTDREAREVLNQPAGDHNAIGHEMLTALPLPVQQWLLASGIVGKERVHTVRLRQRGLMRTSPQGKWMPTSARQYFGVDEPGFVWQADVRMMSFLPLAGRDKYANGKGNMLIKAMALVPIVDASDPATDQGTLLRYLAELCWFPAAALSPYISWQPIDNSHAGAIMTYKGVSAKAIFTFDQQHRISDITARRFMGGGTASTLQNWHIPMRAWRQINGVIIPTQGDVIWQLATGDFTYYRWTITDLDYNKPVLY
ncbi:MAG: hypothetical protein EOO39_22810 [Cytophagaceae bacterium]|nr:MAG: hypothetical protein EOO39_22810 [Cytophagaceae bacterium]